MLLKFHFSSTSNSRQPSISLTFEASMPAEGQDDPLHPPSHEASMPVEGQDDPVQPTSHEPTTKKRTFRVFTKADPNYSLTIRDGRVILAKSDPSDECQHWCKDDKYSTRVKDEHGFPSFALVNKATGEAMKHSIGHTHPVQLKAYKGDVLDESLQWTQANELGEGFRAIRMANNPRLNMDAFLGDKKSGGGSVHDGTIINLWEWNNGINQYWKIIPY